MSGITYVGIAEYKLLDQPGILACSALGSCVGVCLWDTETRLAGLLHALLPTMQDGANSANPFRFADSGIQHMTAAMEKRGASRQRLQAKLTGGACLYHYERSCAATEIGERNIAMARATLRELGIPLIAQHVGGVYGRSIRFEQQTFQVRINILSQGVLII